MPRVTILDTTSTGFIPYYSGAHTAYVDSTGAGGVYANSGLHEGFVIAASTDINDITTGIKSSDLSTIIFSSGNIITGATGQGDIRGTGDGYFHGGTFASKSLDPSSTYFHGLYVPLTGSAGLAGGITTGILGSGASTTPYTGSFTTDEIIYNFTPTFNTTTKSGSGIYTDKTLNLGLEFRDRADQEIDENHELIDNPFISGVDIDILNIDKSVAKSDFKSAYKETNFIFSPDDNEDVFGEFTTNFGVRTRTVNFNGLISTGDIFLYGNRVEIDTIKVVDGTGQFLDQNPINFISPNTGFSNSLAFTNRQKLSDFNIKGSINFDVRLNSVNAKYKNLEIYGTEGDIDTLVLNDVSRKAVIDITTPPFVKFSLTTDNGLDYNTDYHFKIIPSSDLETGRSWTVGPYRIASNQEASVNAFNDGADDQSKQGGAAFGTDEDLDPNARFAVGGAVGRTLLVTKVDSNGNAGDVGIATNNPQQPLDASNVARANIAASDTIIVGTDSAALAGSGHVITGNDNVVAGGETASISGGNFNFVGGGSGINIDHSTFSTSIGGRNNDIFSGDFSVIGGGLNNLITGIASDSHVDKVAIVGGEENKVISAPYSFIGAGNRNLISGTNAIYSSIIGGGDNKIRESQFSAILGGDNNTIEFANHSVSAGNYSKVQSGHAGAFVFSDNRDSLYESTGARTLNLRFESGVFVDTESGIYINGNPVVTGDGAESDTLQTVTARGADTTIALNVSNTIRNRGLIVNNGTLTTANITSEGVISGSSAVIEGNVSGGANFLGTGDGDRITKDNIPYMLSGDSLAPGSVGTLQQVTNNGATTTNSIHLDSDSAQLQFGDANNMQIFHNSAKGEINVAAGDFEIDSAGDIILDAEGNDILFKDAGSTFGKITNNSQNLEIHASTNDKDIVFKGFDNGVGITAMTIDMSKGGNVGIGTTDPSNLLSLVSTVNNNGFRLDYPGTSNTAYPFYVGKDDDSKYVRINANGVALKNNGAESVVKTEGSNNDLNIIGQRNLIFTSNETSEIMRIASDGNVGIGTTSPSNALDVVGHFSATSKSFLIDHPTKENKKLQYASLEGPENGVYVRGTTNEAIIELPEYWSELVHDESITVVLTPIGKKQDLFIIKKSNKLIKIGGVEGSYDYVVYGERKDIDRLEIEPLKV